MRSLVITAAALAVGFALPAAAQSQYGQQGYNQYGQGSGSSQDQYGQGRFNQGQVDQGPVGSQGNSGWNSSSNSSNEGSQNLTNDNHAWQNQNTTDQSGNVRQRIYQELSQAGFTDIHMMPRAFAVHAKDRDGNPVAMVITPNSVTALTTTPGQTGTSDSRQNGNGVAQNYGHFNSGSDSSNSSGWNSNSTMGNNGMNNSDQSGSSINSSNGNGTYSR
ncbi:MAG TPA: hypothetical protein VIZ17_17625 [Acetobacteraceae bacterium]